MSEVKWIKICTDIFDDEKIVLIEGMPEADSIIAIWFKLLCLAGKQNNGGVFMLKENMPYTEEMFSLIFRRPLNTVRLALSTFEQFGMVEIINKTYTIPNWEKHQNVDKLAEIREQTRQRVAKCREKKQLASGNVTGNATVTLCNAIEEDRDGDKEKETHSFIQPGDAEEREAYKRRYLGGSLGKGVVLLSDEQIDSLLDELSIEEFNHYVEVIADCELQGKSFKKKTHYQAILDMAMKDRKKAN
jgi:predicted phage replisome organizer